MKLFILLDDHSQICAISESKKDIKLYQTKKAYTTYSIYKETDESLINEFLLHFEELYLENYEELGLVVTRAESYIIEEILGEERMRLKTTRADLNHFLTNYSLSKKEKLQIENALKLINKISKKKRLIKMIELDKFIAVHSPLKKIRDRLNLTARQIYIFITQKD